MNGWSAHPSTTVRAIYPSVHPSFGWMDGWSGRSQSVSEKNNIQNIVKKNLQYCGATQPEIRLIFSAVLLRSQTNLNSHDFLRCEAKPPEIRMIFSAVTSTERGR